MPKFSRLRRAIFHFFKIYVCVIIKKSRLRRAISRIFLVYTHHYTEIFAPAARYLLVIFYFVPYQYGIVCMNSPPQARFFQHKRSINRGYKGEIARRRQKILPQRAFVESFFLQVAEFSIFKFDFSTSAICRKFFSTSCWIQHFQI